ncbi:MAG: AAA family ATPase [Gemmatimonadetes bacterium]|nr:replication-associated recombination protein A [Gemmatimonadota bacterium]NIQ56426.1 replication-associated recombination protein A [Gemmatimonadota bacterium]NIU76615.1 AAA family ATPase [Gammaproteobacteria bacterium]NIX46062.1 AAA family ATPase [Gemmatimonadota bacterium]NIY10383.1 AAA family ATPase [Gemmatimonadota bacterium]
MRPRTLDEFVGQESVLGPGRALRELIEKDEVGSLILWGPPGTGKTTIARIIAERTDAAFVPFSAVTEGVPRVREIIKEAGERLRATGRRTILFCDEIHRFNKAQQDAFLPHVEAGTITLIGATTENPSFEVIGALLSRARVFVLEPLETGDLEAILRRALADRERGLGERSLEVTDDAIERIARDADGDARRALNALETAATLAGEGGRVDLERAREALQRRFAHYDKGGEEHYNLISALHKAVRGSDPDGALYWLARMLEGGEDPLYIARRLIRMAVEDIGLSDPEALRVAVAARDAFQMLGSPEGDLALAEAAVYLATAPKSNRLYAAFGAARSAARDTPAEPVPLHIRNAPTRLMEELGYGKGYTYAFDSEAHYTAQEYLPESLRGTRFYRPSGFGHEKRIAQRLEWWAARRAEAAGEESGEAEAGEVGAPERRDEG